MGSWSAKNDIEFPELIFSTGRQSPDVMTETHISLPMIFTCHAGQHTSAEFSGFRTELRLSSSDRA